MRPDDFKISSGGLAPLQILNSSGRPNGNSRYLGTEINLSTTYRFAPGIAWDIAGGYLFAGEAMSHAVTVGCCGSTSGSGSNVTASNGVTNSGTFGRGGKDGVNDVIIATTRLRFSF